MYKESEEEKYARILQFLAAEYTHLDNEYEIIILDGTVTALLNLEISGTLMDFKKIFVIALFVVFSNVVMAARIDNLYQAEITVPSDQAGVPTATQVTAGLQQVLVKVTGRSDLQGNPTINAQLPVAQDYLQQFRYQSASVEASPGQSLILDFNPVALDGLINHTGLKPLGVQRPTLLLWLVNDQTGQQQYLNSESEVIGLFKAEAARRGLPVQLPIYDLEDQVALPVSDLWGLFETSIDKASARYLPDAVLAARMQVSQSGFNQVEWIIIDGTSQQRRSTAGPLKEVVSELVNTTADQIFTPIAVPVTYNLSHYQKGIAVNFSNITQFSDYIQATDYLRSLPVVKTLKPELINGSDVTVRLELDGSTDLLKQSLALEPRLQALDFTYGADGSEILHYYWQE